MEAWSVGFLRDAHRVLRELGGQLHSSVSALNAPEWLGW